MDKLLEDLNNGDIEAGKEIVFNLKDGTRVTTKVTKVEKEGIAIIAK